MTKRVKKNKHMGMTKKLLHRKKPMSKEQKEERKKLIADSKKRQAEIDKNKKK